MRNLLTEADFMDALHESNQHPVLLFKHSTQCPISAEACREVTAFQEHHSGSVYMVKVIEERPLSNHLAEVLQIRHASPQALVVHLGKVVWHASHFDITEQSIQEAFQSVRPT